MRFFSKQQFLITKCMSYEHFQNNILGFNIAYKGAVDPRRAHHTAAAVPLVLNGT